MTIETEARAIFWVDRRFVSTRFNINFQCIWLIALFGGFSAAVLATGLRPIFMGVSMFSKWTESAPPDPIQAKIFQWMPVFFTFCWRHPGWFGDLLEMNNLLSMAQWYIMKQVAKSG